MGLTDHFPSESRDLLTVKGSDLLNTLGLPAIRDVVAEVLCGINIRSATEMLTRRRITLLNAAMLTTYVNMHKSGISSNDIPDIAHSEHLGSDSTAEDKTILRWMLGLTGKQVQNVLRSNNSAWANYVTLLKETIATAATDSETKFGDFPIDIENNGLDWSWGLSLLMAVGSQTLAIRGSEKSLYGKFFEKMILGSVLSVMGFEFTENDVSTENSFWLSSRGTKRESDATLIWKDGIGVRFDIGFIGAGNSEITLDKVSRFEKQVEISGTPIQMKTIIIVDRIGKGSRVKELAEEIDGVVVQMSFTDWAQTLGNELEAALPEYVNPLKNLSHSDYAEAIKLGVASAPLEKIFNIAVSVNEEDETDEPSEDEVLDDE